jgi:hypothetical protein
MTEQVKLSRLDPQPHIVLMKPPSANHLETRIRAAAATGAGAGGGTGADATLTSAGTASSGGGGGGLESRVKRDLKAMADDLKWVAREGCTVIDATVVHDGYQGSRDRIREIVRCFRALAGLFFLTD